jgi:hypothetical protein
LREGSDFCDCIEVNLRSVSRLILAMLFVIAGTGSLFGQSQVEFVRTEFGSLIRLHLHSIGASIFPDHFLEASDDLSSWRMVTSVPGGINVWPTVREFSWSTGERRQFFRVRELLNVTGANLAGVNLASQHQAGANLPWANLANAVLAGADFSGANLNHANLRGADLSGAKLRDATLCYADLAGAVGDTNVWAGAALLNTRLPDGEFATDDLLAEALALDYSAELTAPIAVYLRFRRDLAAIRSIVPSGVPSGTRFEWGVPNGLYVWATDEQFAKLNASELGPVYRVQNSPEQVRFARQYHPRALSTVLRQRFGITRIEPFLFAGDGDYVKYDEAESTYTLSRGFGDCPSGCTERWTWVVKVDERGAVSVLGEPFFPPLNDDLLHE